MSTQTESTITPYNLSNFGRAYTAKQAFAALLQQDGTTVEDLRKAWGELSPLLGSVFCEQYDGDGTLSMMNEKHTGMADAATLQLSGDAAIVWDRVRVLQGLISHLKIWAMASAYWTATRPHSADLVGYNARHLICEIYDALTSCDAIQEVEPWAEAVIDAAQAEEEKETST